jgi:hypothetical protein
MNCLECKNLKEAFESRLSKYIEARSAAYYRVSTELAAKKNVDMERAKSELEEHQSLCVSAAESKHPGTRDSHVSILRSGGTETSNYRPYTLEPTQPFAREQLSAFALTYDGGSHGRLRPVDAKAA